MPTGCVDSSKLWLHILLLGKVIKNKSLVDFWALEQCQGFFFIFFGSRAKNKAKPEWFHLISSFFTQHASKVLLTAAPSSNSPVCGDPPLQTNRTLQRSVAQCVNNSNNVESYLRKNTWTAMNSKQVGWSLQQKKQNKTQELIWPKCSTQKSSLNRRMNFVEQE